MSESDFMASVPNGADLLPAIPLGAAQGASERVSGTMSAADSDTKSSLLERIFSFPALLGTLLFGTVAAIAHSMFVDPDVWWHIKQGQWILATHHVPTEDLYSLTLTGRPWTAYEWLGDVLLAAMYNLGGLRGLELLLLLLGGAILIGIYTLAAMRAGNSKAAFVATAAAFVLATISFNLRPQMLGYLFLILTFLALERFRQGKRGALWALPLLMIIWVNAHGSWVIGLVVIGAYLMSGLVSFKIGDVQASAWSAADRLRLIAVLILSAGATLITPYGTQLARYPFDVAFSLPMGVATVQEWLPMPFNLLAGKVFLALLIGFLLLQVIYRSSWRLEDLGLFLFATAVACIHRRFLLIFVPVFTPLLAVALARWVPRYERDKDRHILNAVCMAIVLAIVVRYFPSQADLLQDVGKTYPVAAVEYLDHHSVPAPMYNTYGFGGYLILSRGPQHKVFMDGRSELYEREGFLPDYHEIADIKPGLLATLDKYGIQSCLLNHDEPLATVLAALPEWDKTYEDPTSILFVRRVASTQLSAQSGGAAAPSGN